MPATTKHGEPELTALRARYVFPAVGRPIPDGIVTLRADRIVAVGRETATADVEDLGNVAILPGLINAHTHLDLSGSSGPLGEPGIRLVDWIRRVIKFRQREAPQPLVEQGLQESRRWGTTTLGDIAQSDWARQQVERANVDATVFLELIAPTEQRVALAWKLALQHVLTVKSPAPWRPGLSPHAPYSVQRQLIEKVAALSAARQFPVAFHLAESADELRWLGHGDGPFQDLLRELGIESASPEHWDCPLDYLQALTQCDRALIIHGNYLDDEEIALLGRQYQQMAIVYCPRTHARFQHKPYPLHKMLAVGARVVLGTDSRASAPDLSMLAEMRCVAETFPKIGGDTILAMGTIRAAQALGQSEEVGSLERGKRADLAVVALPDRDEADPYELLFRSNRQVVQTWYRGRQEPQ